MNPSRSINAKEELILEINMMLNTLRILWRRIEGSILISKLYFTELSELRIIRIFGEERRRNIFHE